MTMRTHLSRELTTSALPFALGMILVFSPTPRCDAQTPAIPAAPTTVAALREPPASGGAKDGGTTSSSATGSAAATPDPEIPPAVARQFAAMQAEIEELKAELKSRATTEPALAPAMAPVAKAPDPAPPTTLASPVAQQADATAKLTKPAPSEPFAYADWTWLNGNPRNKDAVWDSKFFTPEIRFDTHYVLDFNHPRDDTLGGSTEIFRTNEVQVEQISVGGDFHWQNVRGRILTMDGMFAVTTPRNDASAGRGQWDLRGAYKYVSEAYGGYHFDVNHGLNVDAGIFVSYIGLFSYYNFDNWAYQPSYVSSNTPWFFNGIRIQWFPTDKLKIEPWVINGWQSYAKFNGHLGLGGQLLWQPTEWFKLVANQYGYGEDNLGLPNTQRIHTDDSILVRYYNNPNNGSGISKMAFSLTGD